MSFIVEPLQLGVGKEYNLNNIKEIKVTEDFLGLSVAKRKCQNEESYEECKTRNYIDALMKTCKCLPFVIGEADKVISLKQAENGLQSRSGWHGLSWTVID